MQRAIVYFPQPDSPTTPSVSPSRTVKLIPSTALTAPIWDLNTIPRVTGKCFFRFSTLRISSFTARLSLRHDRQRLGRLARLRLVVEEARLEVARAR